MNKYTRKMVRVSCGKCPACQQQKANARALRIRNNVRDGEICLFVTLTYSNLFVPYVDRYELTLYHDYVSVWRNAKARMLKDGSRKVVPIVHELSYKHLEYDKSEFVPSSCRDLRGMPNCVGVIWYKDLQDFIKRLKQNLIRKYNEDISFQFFACAEYGGVSHRPHFHLLMYFPASYEKEARCAILESWPYDDGEAKRRCIEVARDAASYVAGYVNWHSSIPSIFKATVFRPKHSYSKGFGVSLECFSLSNILSLADKGSMQYCREVCRDGYTFVSGFLIPRYVVNRYFPQFKGYSWLAVSEIFSALRCSPRRVFVAAERKFFPELPDKWFIYDRNVYNVEYLLGQYGELCYSRDDAHEMMVRQQHAFDYYHDITGKNWFDYVIDYCRVWNCYHATLLRMSYCNDNGTIITDFSDFYENANELYFGVVSSPTLEADFSTFTLDANARKDVVFHTENLTELYYKKDKMKKVVNFAMAGSGINV